MTTLDNELIVSYGQIDRSGPNVTKITYLVGELAKPDANNISITPEFTNFQWMYIKDMDKRVSQITEDALAETDWLVY